MIMTEFKGAVFDLDGTLLDSMDVWYNIDIEFFKKRGMKAPDNYIETITPIVAESSSIPLACSVAP